MLLKSQDYGILKCAACSFVTCREVQIICVQGCDDIVLIVNMYIQLSAAILLASFPKWERQL
jgi:hypothetical protein